MRIVAGRHNGRRLRAPAGAGTRPTADKVREALFSIVGPVHGLRVLDLYAGSGALGIEALSRGAKSATFVESAGPALAAIRAGGVHALAHITGGGLTENLPRVLPEGLGARVDLGAWRLPPVFAWLRQAGGIEDSEMLKTFNSGIGLVAVVAADQAEALARLLIDAGETVVPLGTVTAGQGVTYAGTLA